MEKIYSEEEAPNNIDTEKQTIIDESFPTTIKKMVIERILNNKLTAKSADGNLDTTIALTPENFLGKGISGLVVSANTEKYGKIAMKLFTSKDGLNSEEAQTAYDAEIKILEGLDHPNIAAYYGHTEIEITKTSTIKAIARELIPVEFHQLEVAEAVQLSLNIASALDYLYEKKGAIMPDLSPENLRQRTDGTWAIVDVGHLSLPNIADHQNTIFDERYTAPEIKYTSEVDKNKSASPESEVYSLSLVVWKSLSGVDNDPVDQSITFKKSDEYSPQIIEVLMRGASRNPKDRYPNPTAFAEALKVAAFPQPLVNL